MKINRAFIKGTNWALAGLLSLLGFTGCDIKGPYEYGVPNADYTVKGTVVNKATGKPIEGIRVGYSPEAQFGTMYGVMPTPYQFKNYVITDAKGAFKLSENVFPDQNLIIPVYVEDIDGEQNGLYKADTLQVDFSKAERTKKASHWYEGEYTVTENVKLGEAVDSAAGQ